MRLTNKLNLPDAIVSAIANDDYTRGDAALSVTQLISPPQLVALVKRHENEIEEDAADRIWLLLGKIAHGILERAQSTALREQRLYTTIDGMRISGSFDHLSLTDGVLSDFKVTSTWAVKNSMDKHEWVEQLNCYAYLCAEAGLTVNKLQIVAICRDWSKREAARDDSGLYPKHQVAVIGMPLWPSEQTFEFIRERVRMHRAAEQQLPQCSREDRWQRSDTWAVMKEGNKRAMRVCLSVEEAEAIAAGNSKLAVVHRPGEPIRCQEYCSVSKFCDQYQSELRNGHALTVEPVTA